MTAPGAGLVLGALNFRDVGGLPAGRAVTRSGVLLRSGNLARLRPVDRAALREIGLGVIVDLRDDDEVAAEPSRIEGLAVRTVRAPLFLGSAASFFIDDISLPGMYRTLVDTASERIVEAVRAVIADQPALVHCTVGKDRTGVVIGVMLAAAGVDRDAVVADYARTESLLPAERNARVLAYLRRMHPEARHLEDLATRSPAAVMRELLAGLEARYGSVGDYLRASGMSDDELGQLRRVLLTRSPG